MPTTYTWTGTTDNDFATATNWSPNSSAGGPVGGDSLIFTATTRPLQATLDQSAKTFVSVVITPTMTGDIGISAATPFKTSTITTFINLSGGNVYIYAPMTVCQIAMNSPDLVCNIGSGGTIVDSLFRKGYIQLAAGTFTNIYTNAVNNLDGNLTIQNQGATVTTWEHASGIPSNLTGTITTYNGAAGKLTVFGGTTTNIKLRAAAAADHRSNTNITLLQIYNAEGSFDASRDPRSKTITTVKAHPAANVNLNNGTGNITVTNAQDLTGVTVVGWGVEESFPPV